MRFPLPDHVVKLIAASDCKALGLKTQEEAIAAAEIETERELHKQVANLLRIRGIELFESRMDRKTTRPNGWSCRVIHSVEEALAELKRFPFAM